METIKDIRGSIPPLTAEERKRALFEQVDPLLNCIAGMRPTDAADFCAAVMLAVEHIQDKKQFHYFSSGMGLAALIGAKYVYEVKGFEDPAEQSRPRTKSGGFV